MAVKRTVTDGDGKVVEESKAAGLRLVPPSMPEPPKAKGAASKKKAGGKAAGGKKAVGKGSGSSSRSSSSRSSSKGSRKRSASSTRPATGDTLSRTTTTKDVDPAKLEDAEKAKRLRKIYELRKKVERKKLADEAAMKHRRKTRAEYEGALQELEKELDEQRHGPGPLFVGEPAT